MDKERSANPKISPLHSSLSSSGGLFQAVWAGFAFFYGSRLASMIGLVGAVLVLALGGLVAAACVPLVYFTVNRTKSGFWGRYHFTLAVSVLIASILCAAMFGAESDSAPARIATACFGVPLFGAAMAAIAYISFSINSRIASDDTRGGKARGIFNIAGLLLGVALCALPFTGMQADSVGYALASLIIVVGAAVYFSGADYLPRFVRPLSKKMTFAAVKEEFFKKPSKSTALSGTAYFLFAAVSLLCVGYMTTAMNFYELSPWVALICLALSVSLGAMCYVIVGRTGAAAAAVIAGGIISTVSPCALLFILRFASLSVLAASALTASAFALCGIGGGLALAGAKKSVSGFAGKYTSGAAFCLEFMLFTVATAAASAVAAALSRMSAAADIVFACVTGAAALAGLVLVTVAHKIKPTQKEADAQGGRTTE